MAKEKKREVKKIDKSLEVTSHCSYIVYRIESFTKIKTPKKAIYNYIELEKTMGNFPKELEYITSFYNTIFTYSTQVLINILHYF